MTIQGPYDRETAAAKPCPACRVYQEGARDGQNHGRWGREVGQRFFGHRFAFGFSTLKKTWLPVWKLLV